MKKDDNSQSLATEAYLLLRQRILRGELSIGQVISRRKISSELGMSLLPISEALRRLEFEGLVESRPRAGTRIRIPTEEGVRGHYAVREALEVQAARMFAENATSEEKAELMRLAVRVDTMGQSPAADRVVYLSLHEQLHGRIAQYARCAPLNEAIEKTHALASTWLCVAKPASSNGAPRRRHQDLIAALSKGDKEIAAEAMRDHIVGSMERTLARLEPYFRLGDGHGTRYSRAAKQTLNTGAIA